MTLFINGAKARTMNFQFWGYRLCPEDDGALH